MSTEEQVCLSCKNPLSIYPIFRELNTKDINYICGRWSCRKSTFSKNCARSKTYEDLFASKTFSCANESSGCTKELIPSEMETHEECCKFGFEDDNFYNTRLAAMIQFRSAAKCLQSIEEGQDFGGKLIVEEDVLTLTKNSMFFFVLQTHQVEQFAIFASLSQYSDRNPALFLIKVLDVNEKLTCSNRYVSRIAYGDFCEFNFDMEVTNVLSLDLPAKVESFKFRIEIVKTEDVSKTVCRHYVDVPFVDYDLLSSLKCEKCSFHLFGEIYHCMEGHCFCGGCSKKLKVCTCCGSKMDFNNRNSALEKVVKSLGFPCKNSTHGCEFVGPLADLNPHYGTCSFVPRGCVLWPYTGCYWFSYTDTLLSHLEEKHKDVVCSDVVTSIVVDRDFFARVHEDFHVISKKGHLFLVRFKYQDETFKWQVKMPLLNSVDIDCMLRITVFGDNDNGQVTLFRKLDSNVIAEDTEYIVTLTLKLDAIKSLIEDCFGYEIRFKFPKDKKSMFL